MRVQAQEPTPRSNTANPGERGFSAPRKAATVLRLLRGESLELLSRELGVTAATLAGWRDDFLAGGQAALKSRPADDRDEEIARLRAKVRVVPMSPRVRTLLAHDFALQKAFPAKTRRAQDIVRAVADRAGITRDVSPHVLRHTFATTTLQKGISLPTVQKILGHDRLQTTAISLNFTDVPFQDEFERKW